MSRTASHLLIAAAIALIAPTFASAASYNVAVTYTAEEKPLKALVAGSSVLLQLYTDPTCSSSPVATQPTLIENVTLINKLKQLTPKGDVKLPNTVELRTTVSNVALSAANQQLYLLVSDPNVLPVGGACQLQAAAIPAATAGPTIISFSDTVGGTIAAGSPLAFVGPTSTLPLTTGQKVSGTLTAGLGSTSVSTAGFLYDLCFQFGAGAVTRFSAGLFAIQKFGSEIGSFTATATTTIATTGTYTLGYCVENPNAVALDYNDFVTGFMQVTS